jgi:hypothetical protein
MPTPQLHVETIAFHGNDVSALPLVEGQVPIEGSEWTRDGTRKPAAFVAPRQRDHISFRATFSSPDMAGRTAIVFASRLEGAGHVIQDVAPATVTFDSAGRGGPIELRAALSNRHIDLDRARWQWRFRDGPSLHDSTISEHEIAVVLETPQPPWTAVMAAPAGTSLPWWEVLRYACDAAHGAATLDEAAGRLTGTVFGKWGGKYYRWNQIAETFASDAGDPLAFDCRRFLELLDDPPPATPEIVDCSDIATILSTFASILGCPIQQVVLEDELRCRMVRMVGHGEGEWKVREFPIHEIAVKVPLVTSPDVWDGCLMVSGDDPIGPGIPTSALLPSGLGSVEYLQRLLRTRGSLFNNHVMFGPLSRPLGSLSNILPSPASDAPGVAPATFEPQAFPDDRRVVAFDPQILREDGWSVQVETDFPTLDAAAADATAVARVTCTWTTDPTRRVRVTLYLCPNADAAHRRLGYLRGKLAPPLSAIQDGPDRAFASDDGKTIVGVFMNVAYRIIDAGGGPVTETAAMTTATATFDASTMKTVLTSRLAAALPPL